MNCMHCGTPLPSGAIFCGECGRRASSAPVAASTPANAPPATRPAVDAPPPPAPELDGPPARGLSRTRSRSDAADAASRALAADVAPRSEPEPAPGPAAGDRATRPEFAETVPESQARSAAEAALAGVVRNPLACDQCGTAMGPGDIFCGECGSVSRSVTAAFTRSTPVPPAGEGAPPVTIVDVPEAVAVELPEVTGERPVRSKSVRSVPPLPTMPIFVQSPPGAAPVPVVAPRDPAPLPSVPVPPVASPPPPAAAEPRPKAVAPSDKDHDDVEATRIVSRRGGERFVLQFSTGESVTVYGTGLIGRNPRPEPGEYFDQLVRVLDTGRSVSKTHLEFGQDSGVFWIKDRFSGNGTVLKEPDAPPRRCEPDRRCRVLRGSRVEVGEQFFVVS